MSRKRRNTSSPECDSSPPSKRPLSVISPANDEDRDFYGDEDVKEQPRLDPDSGLHNAFPGLGADGDELFYGPATDGLDYLRMVRSEAKAVPSLLVAKSHIDIEPANEENEQGFAQGGIYADGAYTAIATTSHTSSTLLPAQQMYHEALLERFMSLRARIRCNPPLPAVQALDESRPTTFPPRSATARSAWGRYILQYDPHPVQVASIGPDSLLELIKVLTESLEKLLGAGPFKTTRLGLWVWALLARFPDRGELGSEEIAELRALASRAFKVMGINCGQGVPTDANEERPEDGDDDIGSLMKQALEAREGVEETGSMADKASHITEFPTPNSMILDAIFTIIGEVYGQRDLLELREVWTQEETLSVVNID